MVFLAAAASLLVLPSLLLLSHPFPDEGGLEGLDGAGLLIASRERNGSPAEMGRCCHVPLLSEEA